VILYLGDTCVGVDDVDVAVEDGAVIAAAARIVCINTPIG
jgi:hypothetical protein